MGHVSDPQCLASANQSAAWLEENFGVFAGVASIRELLTLNPLFDPVRPRRTDPRRHGPVCVGSVVTPLFCSVPQLDVLPLLTPLQTAELLVSTGPTLPNSDVIINAVFDFLDLNGSEFASVLRDLVVLLPKVKTLKWLTFMLHLCLVAASVNESVPSPF